jgi:hypothetical protein
MFMSLLTRLTVLQIDADDVFNVEKYNEKCSTVHGELYISRIEYPQLMERIELPNIYFNIEYVQ